MAYTYTTFTYDGDTDFDLSFAGGYRVQSDVTAIKVSVPEAPVSFDWLSEHRVRISTAGLKIGDRIQFRRTVSKTDLPVDMMLPNNFTREAVVAAVTHTLQALQEVLDGRVDGLDPVLIEVLNRYISEAGVLVEQAGAQAELAENRASEAQNYAEEAALYAGQVFEPETIFAQQYQNAKLTRV